jgi:hypothetical protein
MNVPPTSTAMIFEPMCALRRTVGHHRTRRSAPRLEKVAGHEMNALASRTSTFGAVVGVGMGIFGLLTSFWIPTLALLFSVGATVFGLIQVRGSSGSRRSLAKMAIALGIGGGLLVIAIVLLTTGSSSGTAITSV